MREFFFYEMVIFNKNRFNWGLNVKVKKSKNNVILCLMIYNIYDKDMYV